MRTRPGVLAAAGAIVAALLLAGCGSGDDHASRPHPSASVHVSASSGGHDSGAGGTTGGGSTDASGGGAVPAGKRCGAGELAATVRPLGAAAGTHFASIVLTNNGHRSCRTSGYPGLQLLSAHGAKLPTSVRHETAKRPTVVTLAPGARMHSAASWGAVAGAGESQSGGCEQNPTAVRVALPGVSGTVRATWSYGPVCGHGTITVGALAPGAGRTAG